MSPAEKYNQPNSLLVISSYPPKGTTYGDQVGGVASFTKNNLLPLAQKQKIIVLAEILNRRELYEEGNILVCRCWRRNFPGIYLDLLKGIFSFSKIIQIKVQFEFSLYGDFLITAFLPLFLLFLKILQKESIIVIHQVLLNLRSLSGHLGWFQDNFKESFFSFFLRWYYRFLALTTEKIVVLEPIFKKRLERVGINANKVFVIKHGVDRSISFVNKSTARSKLGIDKNNLVILSFGFLTWYKGSDLLVEAFNRLNKKFPDKKTSLILAGGESITQKQKQHYRQYIKSLYKSADKNPKITITGFVPEQSLKLYFGAADLVVLPYRTFMSSSGVLSLTLSFNKPFILSETLKGWFDDLEEDAQKLPDFLFFKASVNNLAKSLEKIIFDETKLKVLSGLSFKLSRARDYQQIALAYQGLWKDRKRQSLIRPLRLRLATAD